MSLLSSEAQAFLRRKAAEHYANLATQISPEKAMTFTVQKFGFTADEIRAALNEAKV